MIFDAEIERQHSRVPSQVIEKYLCSFLEARVGPVQ
jgi:hypothetical protein